MNTQTRTLPERFRVLLTLAQLLERLERNLIPTAAEQYRSVVDHLCKELTQAEPGDDLQALLDSFPATAELYENLHYVHAGLCRSPLDASLTAEVRAKELIRRLQR
jgi:adenylate kinase family enzyme